MSDIHLAPRTTPYPFLAARNDLASLIDDIQNANGKPVKVSPERLICVLTNTLRHMTEACHVINQGQIEGVHVTVPSSTSRERTTSVPPASKRTRGLSERSVE